MNAGVQFDLSGSLSGLNCSEYVKIKACADAADNYCQLDSVSSYPARASSEVGNNTIELIELPIESAQPVTLEVRAERIRHLQADVQRGIIEIGFELIAAKKQVGHGGWADWLKKEFEWTQQTANRFMRVAERFGKLNVDVQFQSSTLQEMLALPEGDEDAFIEAQVAAGKPVENQSKREVRESVKQWKEAKSKEGSATVNNEFNLFADECELADQSQSVGKSDSAPIQNAEMTSTPTEESVDEVASAEPIKSFTDEENRCVALEKKRAETQKLLDEISMLIQTAADTKLDETIRELKSICDALSLSPSLG